MTERDSFKQGTVSTATENTDHSAMKAIFHPLTMPSLVVLFSVFVAIYALLPNVGSDDYAVHIINPTGLVDDSGFDPATFGFQLNVRNMTRPHPAVQQLPNKFRATTAMAAKFRSLYPKKLDMWYDDGKEGTFNGHISLGQETTTNSYHGHEFYFTENGGDKKKEVARVKMNKDQVMYIIEHPDFPAPADLKQRTEEELAFMAEYYNHTGIHWRHYFGPKSNGPRPPPTLYMWPADSIGQVHAISSMEGYWFCEGSPDMCQSQQPVDFELEVISQQPRAFIIHNFLSDYETDVIVENCAKKLGRSSVGDSTNGGFSSDTRTSLNTWLKRDTSAITESLFTRAAHLLRINDKLLSHRHTVEHLQVVHYENGQKYDSHHDWGVSGYPESRFITLLLYLNDQASPNAGGETAFPKAAGGKGIKVHPGKGSAVLFYNLLEDGNGDDLSIHAALPTTEGEKWLANFWVWDPKKK